MPSTPTRSAPVALPDTRELDRRLRWRVLPIAFFAALMVLLASVALGSLTCAPRVAHGLPDDPDVAAARGTVASVPVRSGAYRFAAALLPAADAARPFDAADARALAEAAERLERARGRRPFEPRVWAALAAVDLAAHRLRRAERRYRIALELAPHYPEARLGLGVALALRARTSDDPVERRRLRLAAIGQLAAVPADGECGAEALYDRALLLHDAGREAEAAAARAAYRGLDPGSEWYRRLEPPGPPDDTP